MMTLFDRIEGWLAVHLAFCLDPIYIFKVNIMKMKYHYV